MCQKRHARSFHLTTIRPRRQTENRRPTRPRSRNKRDREQKEPADNSKSWSTPRLDRSTRCRSICGRGFRRLAETNPPHAETDPPDLCPFRRPGRLVRQIKAQLFSCRSFVNRVVDSVRALIFCRVTLRLHVMIHSGASTSLWHSPGAKLNR